MVFVALIRIFNKVLAKVASTLQLSRVWNKPANAIFEMSSSCNLNCPLCNTGGMRKEYSHVQRGIMSFSTFNAGLDKLLPQVESILLYNWGEPFLNRDLFSCIGYARQHNVKTQLSTNMMLYTEEIGRKLIAMELTKLVVSCDGVTQETYERYRRGGKLSKVIEGVENLLALKQELSAKLPLIEMQCVVFKFNEHELGEYERFWKGKGVDSINFIRMSYMSRQGKELAEQLDFVPENPEFRPYHPYGSLKKCSDLYSQVTIDWNGDWYTCCFPAGERDYRVGNIVTDDFWTVWNGEKYRYSRKLLKTCSSGEGYCETMCHDCTGIYPREETRRYWE